jgi:uncharacterized protein (TIGR00369 family)
VAFATKLGEGVVLAIRDLKINYLKSLWEGKILAVGSVVHKCKVTGLVAGGVLGESKQLVASDRSTYLTISGEQVKN